MDAVPTPATEPIAVGGSRIAIAFALALFVLVGLMSGLGYLLIKQTSWLREADEANLREWLNESAVFRKTLPELVRDYVTLRDRDRVSEENSSQVSKRQEIAEQIVRLAEPTRTYQGKLPLFPTIYLIEISFPGTEWKPIAWRSPLPQPRPQLKALSELKYPLLGPEETRVELRCTFRLHAYDVRQQETDDAQRRLAMVIGWSSVLIIPALFGTYLLWRRERHRETERVVALQRAEHAAQEALRQQVARREAERAKEEAGRHALELKSQLFANIGITAGSYAHNIKNLLLRPQDLLARCLDADGMSEQQRERLGEVRSTLGTVTERLQQILQTVRRDPTRVDLDSLDLNVMIGELAETWKDLAREKWKLSLTTELAAEPLPVRGDRSNLVQMLENLLFNARDATFEKRNELRETARAAASDGAQRQQLIDAAAWRGTVTLRTKSMPGGPVLEVVDNGVGMSDEVRQRCTETHFSTKRDNALFEGLNAGMGLGLSFVTMVLERHGAQLSIDSTPGQGATFRVTFPVVPSPAAAPAPGRARNDPRDR